MPRPPKRRRVAHVPGVTYFKPAGVPLRTLEQVTLGIDELEALRLKDLAGLEQEACAREMQVSQSTLQRVLTAARSKVAEALVYGKAICIEGGPVEVTGPHPADPAVPEDPGTIGQGPAWAAGGTPGSEQYPGAEGSRWRGGRAGGGRRRGRGW